MVKAIIFDCFGVVATDGWLPFKRQYFGDSPKKMERATELNHMVDAGLISYKDFSREIASMAKVSPEHFDKIIKSVVADNSTLQYIAEELKPQYKIGMLSNVADDWLQTLFSESQRNLFDEIALSYKIGAIKPDPRAYEAISNQLDVAAEECIFVDDQERNVTGAQEIGMQALVYKNLDQCKSDLQKLLRT